MFDRSAPGRRTAQEPAAASSTPTSESGIGPISEAVLTVAEAVLAVPIDDVDTLGPQAVTVALRRVDASVERLTALRLRLISAQRHSGVWKDLGDRSYEAYRGRVTRTGERTARSEARLADAVQSAPAVGQALDRGEITTQHVAALARVTSGPQRSPRVAEAVSADGGERLVTMAKRMNAGEFARAAEHWAASLDAADVEQGFQRVRARRYLRVHDSDGGTRIDGLLDPIAGHAVTLALEAATARPGMDDNRSADQRRADALTDIAARSLALGDSKADALVRPHISLVLTEQTWAAARARRDRARSGASAGASASSASAVDLGSHAGGRRPPEETVVAPPATTLGGTIVAPTVLDQLACDCELTRIVLGADSELLDVGRAQRSYSRQVRRAVIARDRHCRWPGCDRPARWCEVHHITFWSHGGTTSAVNGITLCSFHHHEVHRGTATIETVARGHRFIAHDGRLIGESLRDPTAVVPGAEVMTTVQVPAAPIERAAPGRRPRTSRQRRGDCAVDPLLELAAPRPVENDFDDARAGPG